MGIYDLECEQRYQLMVTQLKKSGEDILSQMTPLKASLGHLAIGISGEAGELSDALKRHYAYNKELDMANVIEELGDIEWFMEAIRQELGINRADTLRANHYKLLKKRYPKGYSDADAIARADKQEVEEQSPAPKCSVYKEPQFDTAHGVTCSNGPGGAEPL